MTAIDFAAFVDELATVSGETIRPFFRSALAAKVWAGEQKPFRRLRSGHRRRPRRRSRDAHADQADLSRAWRRRRGIRRRPCRRRICLGARSDRRHQIVHLRHAGLGHADRADPPRRADLRHDAPAVHPRAFFRRRPRRALSRPGRRSRFARAPLRLARRRHPGHHQSAPDEQRRPAMLRPRRKSGAAVALWRRLLRLLRARRRPCRSRHRDRAQAARRAGADPDHRRRRRHHHHVGQRPAA